MSKEEEDIKWIKEATYAELLYKWRFAKIGDSMFQDKEVYNIFTKSMSEKSPSTSEKVRISKKVGW